MIDSILTKNSDDVADSTTVTLLAASAKLRPYVSYFAFDLSGGTLQLKVGGRVIATNDDTDGPGLIVGNKNEAITLTSDATLATKRYVVTCGHLAVSGGDPLSGAVSA